MSCRRGREAQGHKEPGPARPGGSPTYTAQKGLGARQGVGGGGPSILHLLCHPLFQS